MTSTQPTLVRAAGQQMMALTTRLCQHMTRCGYELIELPIMQQADLFLTKAGDQIIEHLFTFERGGCEWSLRPEFTAAAAHLYSQIQSPGTVVRWQFAGPTFEEDPNRWTQEYQSLSIGAELIGVRSSLADAEIMAMALQGLAACGIEDGRLVIGHMGLLRQVLAQFGLDSKTAYFILHHLAALFNPHEGKAFVLEQLQGILQIAAPQVTDVHLIPPAATLIGGRTPAEIENRIIRKRLRAAERERVSAALDALLEWGNIEGKAVDVLSYLQARAESPAVRSALDEWSAALQLLSAYGIAVSRVLLKPGLVRSWEYYTGFVFEIYADDQHLGGGGRYDELVQLVGGSQSVPAVGFVYYGDKLMDAAPRLTATIAEMQIAAQAGLEALAVQWAQALRNRGVAVAIMESGSEINADGTLQFNSKAYSIADIDILLRDLFAANGVNS